MEVKIMENTIPNINQIKIELIEIAPGLKITANSSALFDAMSKAQQEIGSLSRNKKGYG